MKPARLVVLASGRGSNFVALDRAIAEGRCAATVVAVVSDKPEAPVLELARARGIATSVEPLAKGADRAAWSERLADAVASHAPDYVVLAGFMRILSPAFLDRFASRVLNVHPSLLPAFPGHDAPAQALAAGVRISGCTVHVVDHGVDTGPILAQAAIPVLPSDDVASLHARIQTAEHELFAATIDALVRGSLTTSAPRTTSLPIDTSARFLVPSFAQRT